MALSHLTSEGRLFVVENMKSEGKTAEIAKRLKAFGVAKAVLEKAQQDIKAAAVKTDIQREQLRLSLEEAQLSYQQMQSELTLLNERQAAEWRIAELGKEAQVRHRGRHRVDLARFNIRAPRNGQANSIAQIGMV